MYMSKAVVLHKETNSPEWVNRSPAIRNLEEKNLITLKENLLG
jgi:hypothetical protein